MPSTQMSGESLGRESIYLKKQRTRSVQKRIPSTRNSGESLDENRISEKRKGYGASRNEYPQLEVQENPYARIDFMKKTMDMKCQEMNTLNSTFRRILRRE